MAGFGLFDDYNADDHPLLNDNENEPINIPNSLTNDSQFKVSNNLGHRITNAEIFDDFGEVSNPDLDEHQFLQHCSSPRKYNFYELKEEMSEISDGIFKKIVKHGLEQFGLLPEADARVVIAYELYKELDEEPIDSTILRGSNETLYTGTNGMLCGLEKALCSMYKGEMSQFVISYKYLFGENGCPPRIPPNSDLFFIINIIDFTDISDLNAVNEVEEEDPHKSIIVFRKVKELHNTGKDFFKLRNYKFAIETFFRAVELLQSCQLSDASDELEQKYYLKILYTNLAVCYYKKEFPKKVCSVLHALRKIDESAYNSNVKALYFDGRSMIKLNDYKGAGISLRKAQRIEPGNPDIAKALKELAEKEAKHKKFAEEKYKREIRILNNTKILLDK